MEQVLIFANPIAGRGKGRAIAHRLGAHLGHLGYRVTTFLSKPQAPVAKPSEGPIKAAIIVGGDGTLRGVAQWAIDNVHIAAAPHSAIVFPYPLLIIPMGTANLMGKHLGLSWSDEHLAQEVAAVLTSGKIVHLDAARTQGGIFLLMAGVGIDGWIVHELDRIRDGPIDMTKYFLPAAKAMAGYHFSRLTATVDGRRVFDNRPALAMIGNIPEYGAGVTILPHARPDDGLLDVCIMPCASAGQLVQLFLNVAAGEHLDQEGVIYVKGKSIQIDSPHPVPVQVDGEAAGTTPLEIDLLPFRVPFIVPS